MIPKCSKCGKLVSLHDLPLFFVGELLISLMGQTGNYVCSKCTAQQETEKKA
jgi:DNA-directed RNA polymerase subunit RPC12/RpoP